MSENCSRSLVSPESLLAASRVTPCVAVQVWDPATLRLSARGIWLWSAQPLSWCFLASGRHPEGWHRPAPGCGAAASSPAKAGAGKEMGRKGLLEQVPFGAGGGGNELVALGQPAASAPCLFLPPTHLLGWGACTEGGGSQRPHSPAALALSPSRPLLRCLRRGALLRGTLAR